MGQAKYLNSENVNVFPSTRRTYSQSAFSTRLMTESAIARLINKLIDYEGFVISETINDDLFELNLYGYYFQVTKLQEFITSNFNSDTNLYASVIIDPSGSPAYQELYVPAENSSVTTFQGLIFTNDENPSVTLPTNGFLKTLKIAIKENSTWIIPDESRMKFNLRSVGLIEIDGGIIE